MRKGFKLTAQRILCHHLWQFCRHTRYIHTPHTSRRMRGSHCEASSTEYFRYLTRVGGPAKYLQDDCAPGTSICNHQLWNLLERCAGCCIYSPLWWSNRLVSISILNTYIYLNRMWFNRFQPIQPTTENEHLWEFGRIFANNKCRCTVQFWQQTTAVDHCISTASHRIHLTKRLTSQLGCRGCHRISIENCKMHRHTHTGHTIGVNYYYNCYLLLLFFVTRMHRSLRVCLCRTSGIVYEL